MKNVTKIHRNLSEQNRSHPVFGGSNEISLGYLAQAQKCVQTLDKMGLHVLNIHFEKIKPQVRVQPCKETQKLEKSGQAIAYVQGNDGVHFAEYQMMVEGIKVIWRSYLH